MMRGGCGFKMNISTSLTCPGLSSRCLLAERRCLPHRELICCTLAAWQLARLVFIKVDMKFYPFFLGHFCFFSLFPATRKMSLQRCLFLPFQYQGGGKKQSMDILQSGFTFNCLLGPFGPFDPLVFLVLLSRCSAV